MTRVQINESAKQDIIAMTTYTENKWGPRQKDILKRQLESAISFVGTFPDCGQKTLRPNTLARVIPQIPFIIVYKKSNDIIKVFRVVHTSRKRYL
jgi:plasmid stabilization system protein ParE